NRTARLASRLLQVPQARVYLRRGDSLDLCASFPSRPAGLADDPLPRSIAAEVVRTLAPMRVPRSDWGSSGGAPFRMEAGGTAHLGVPIATSNGGVLGATVVSDPAGRTWSDTEVECLADLCALGAGAVDQLETMVRAPAPAAQAAGADRPSSAESQRRARPGEAHRTPAQLFSEAGDAALVEIIRHNIVGRLHLGALSAGDRLPSIRQTARAFSVTPYMVLQAYAELEVEGLVERRERSGMFVADFEASDATSLPETGAWLTEVLTQACQHQVKIPLLPD